MDDFSLLFASDDWKYFEGRAAVVVIVIRFFKDIIFCWNWLFRGITFHPARRDWTRRQFAAKTTFIFLMNWFLFFIVPPDWPDAPFFLSMTFLAVEQIAICNACFFFPHIVAFGNFLPSCLSWLTFFSRLCHFFAWKVFQRKKKKNVRPDIRCQVSIKKYLSDILLFWCIRKKRINIRWISSIAGKLHKN